MKDDWRTNLNAEQTAEVCRQFTLPPSGTIVLPGSRTIVAPSGATFKPQCDDRGFLAAAMHKPRVESIVEKYGNGGPRPFRQNFNYGLVPTIYSAALATAVVGILSIAQFTNHRANSKFLRLVLFICLCSVCAISGIVIQLVKSQYDRGYYDGYQFTFDLHDNTAAAILRLVASFTLELTEVRTVVRFFARKREKCIIFWCGVALATVGQIIFLVNVFAPTRVSERGDDVDALIVFGYLFEIAIAILYCGCIVFYAFIKLGLLLRHPWLLIWSVICLCLAFTPVLLFILDLTHEELDAWTEYAWMMGYSCAATGVWWWVDQLEIIERHAQQSSVLGRELYIEDVDIKTDSGFSSSDHTYELDQTPWWNFLTEIPRPGTSSTNKTSYVVTNRVDNDGYDDDDEESMQKFVYPTPKKT